MSLLKRFWFKFLLEDISKYPGGIGYGCGVTALNYDDAVNLLKAKVFIDIGMPEIDMIIENININDLDQGHVVVNMNPPNRRGVWFPMGFDQ